MATSTSNNGQQRFSNVYLLGEMYALVWPRLYLDGHRKRDKIKGKIDVFTMTPQMNGISQQQQHFDRFCESSKLWQEAFSQKEKSECSASYQDKNGNICFRILLEVDTV